MVCGYNVFYNVRRRRLDERMPIYIFLLANSGYIVSPPFLALEPSFVEASKGIN